MSLLALCSAHGSPGVTTAALTLGATWPSETVVVEADPSGGVVAARFGLGDSPGLGSLAVAARSGLTAETLTVQTQRLPGGLPVVVGAGLPEQATAVIRDVSGPLIDLAAGNDGADVIVDCGRVWPGAASSELLRQADLALVVVRPSADQLRHAAHRAGTLLAAGAVVSLLLVGETPYGRDEVAETFRLVVAGVVADDPRAAGTVNGTPHPAGRGARWLQHTLLVRSAATVAERLASRVHATPAEVTTEGGRS